VIPTASAIAVTTTAATAITTAATAITAAAAAAAAAAVTRSALLGFTDPEAASVHIAPIKAINGRFAKLARAKGHESKSAGASRFAVHGDVEIDY
jgi:hypothetical protein